MTVTFEDLMEETMAEEGFQAFNILQFRNDHVDIEYWKGGAKFLKSFSEGVDGDWIVVNNEG